MQTQIPTFIPLTTLPTREILRAPITFLLATTATFATLIIPLVLAFQFGDTGRRLVRDGGLGLQLTIGILLAAICACNLIHRERQSGVAAMLLTKPVARHWYLLSRFVAVSTVIMLFSAITTSATMLAHRAAEALDVEAGFRTDYRAALSGILCIPLACAAGAWRNWRKNDSFHAVALLALPILLVTACLLGGFITRAGNLTLQYNPQLDVRIIVTALSLSIALMVFTALALTLSIILPPVTTTALCLIVLFSGLMSPLLLANESILKPLYALLPNWNWFWLAEYLDATQTGLLSPFVFSAIYGLCLTGGILTLGIMMIEKVEVPA